MLNVFNTVDCPTSSVNNAYLGFENNMQVTVQRQMNFEAYGSWVTVRNRPPKDAVVHQATHFVKGLFRFAFREEMGHLSSCYKTQTGRELNYIFLQNRRKTCVNHREDSWRSRPHFGIKKATKFTDGLQQDASVAVVQPVTLRRCINCSEQKQRRALQSIVHSS